MELISRQQAIDAVNGLIDRFEQILRDIREANGDDSVCGMCEYDGAYIGQSGDWCNECPGFDKEDCFKLSDKCRKRWLKSVELPPAEVGTGCSEFPNNSDAISRQAAIEALDKRFDNVPKGQTTEILLLRKDLRELPSEQPERKKGEWIDDGTELGCCCSECGDTLDDYFDGALCEIRLSQIPNFCPSCGSYNRGEEDDKCRQV